MYKSQNGKLETFLGGRNNKYTIHQLTSFRNCRK